MPIDAMHSPDHGHWCVHTHSDAEPRTWPATSTGPPEEVDGGCRLQQRTGVSLGYGRRAELPPPHAWCRTARVSALHQVARYGPRGRDGSVPRDDALSEKVVGSAQHVLDVAPRGEVSRFTLPERDPWCRARGTS